MIHYIMCIHNSLKCKGGILYWAILLSLTVHLDFWNKKVSYYNFSKKSKLDRHGIYPWPVFKVKNTEPSHHDHESNPVNYYKTNAKITGKIFYHQQHYRKTNRHSAVHHQPCNPILDARSTMYQFTSNSYQILIFCFFSLLAFHVFPFFTKKIYGKYFLLTASCLTINPS